MKYFLFLLLSLSLTIPTQAAEKPSLALKSLAISQVAYMRSPSLENAKLLVAAVEAAEKDGINIEEHPWIIGGIEHVRQFILRKEKELKETEK